MGLLVKMHNGDVERFDSATSWYVTDDGGLTLWPQDKTAGNPVAQFASGAWLAVFEVPSPRPAPAESFHLGPRAAPTDKAVRRSA